MDQPLRVCYFGTYRSEYSRNRIMIEGLRQNQVIVVECHEKLWHGVEDRVQVARGGWLHPKFWLRVVTTYMRLLKRYLNVGHYDVLIVGYPGQFDVFLARLLSWLRRKPLVWDILNSLYLITLERGIYKSNTITGLLIKNLEKLACHLPDLLILDTLQFVNWFQNIYNIDVEKFRLVQIGADDRYFRPTHTKRPPDNEFRVIYYGSYIPNHGVPYIIRSALLLSDSPSIQFEMIGEGPDLSIAQNLVRQHALENVTFTGWLDRKDLVEHITLADLVLGVFGTTRQMDLTNNNKIYEAFSMKKPVISGASPALPEIVQHKEHLYLCERGQPNSLANGIIELKTNPELRYHIAEQGYRIFHQYFDVYHIGQRFANHLKELVKQMQTTDSSSVKKTKLTIK